MAIKKHRWNLMGLVVAGLLMLSLLGARFVLGVWYPFMYLPLALMLVIVGLLLFINRQTLWKLIGHKSTKKSLSSGALLIYLVVGLVGINYVTLKWDQVLDMTKENRLSLSWDSEQVIGKLRSHFDVTLYHRGTEDKLSVERFRKLYKLFQQISPMAGQFRVLGIYENFEEVNSRLNAAETRQFDGIRVIVSCNGNDHKVTHPHGEVEFVQTLNKCFVRQKRRVGIVVNHGEWQLDGKNELQILAEELKQLHIELVEVSLLRGSLSADVEALMILGPRTDFLGTELQALEEFLDKGGMAFFAIDPNHKSNLGAFLKKYSIQPSYEYVLQISGNTGTSNLQARNFNLDNSISASLVGGSLYFDLVTSLTTVEGVKKWKVSDLVYSGNDTFKVKKIGNYEIKPELKSHLIAAKSQGEKGKMIVVGDSDWLTDQWFPVFYNKNFAISVLSDLLEDNSLAVLPARNFKNEPIYFARLQLASFFAMCLLTPVMLLFASIVVWWKGRS